MTYFALLEEGPLHGRCEGCGSINTGEPSISFYVVRAEKDEHGHIKKRRTFTGSICVNCQEEGRAIDTDKSIVAAVYRDFKGT